MKSPSRLQIEQLQSQIENELRAGNHQHIKQIFAGLEIKKLPREGLLPLASLANRAKCPYVALKILSNCIRADTSVAASTATPMELAEYGNSLHKIGSHQEAHRILLGLDPSVHQNIRRTQAFSFIYLWDYESAGELLRLYLQTVETGSVDWWLGNVNLLASLLSCGKYSECGQLVEKLEFLIQESDIQQRHPLLVANFFEQVAQLHFYDHNFTKARMQTERAAAILLHRESIYHLLIQKWKNIIDLFDGKISAHSWFEFRKKAADVGHWETIRECDLYFALYMKDSLALSRLFLASANGFYRAKIQRLAPKAWAPLESVVWPDSNSDRVPLNFLRSNESGQRMSLEDQTGLLRLFKVLSSDLYSPWHLGSLFSSLYPDEYFDPFRSPNRVHQLIRRLRVRLASMHGNVEIVENSSTYFLDFGSRGGLTLNLESQVPTGKYHLLLLKLMGSTSQPVSVEMAAKVLQCPPTQASRVLRWGVDNGKVIKTGQGRATVYILRSA